MTLARAKAAKCRPCLPLLRRQTDTTSAEAEEEEDPPRQSSIGELVSSSRSSEFVARTAHSRPHVPLSRNTADGPSKRAGQTRGTAPRSSWPRTQTPPAWVCSKMYYGLLRWVRVYVASTWQRRGDCCAVVRQVENSSCGGSDATVATFKPVKLNGSSLSYN